MPIRVPVEVLIEVSIEVSIEVFVRVPIGVPKIKELIGGLNGCTRLAVVEYRTVYFLYWRSPHGCRRRERSTALVLARTGTSVR